MYNNIAIHSVHQKSDLIENLFTHGFQMCTSQGDQFSDDLNDNSVVVHGKEDSFLYVPFAKCKKDGMEKIQCRKFQG
jgi:hypothetical protein